MSRCCEEYRERGKKRVERRRKKGREGIGHNKQEGERMRKKEGERKRGTEKEEEERKRRERVELASKRKKRNIGDNSEGVPCMLLCFLTVCCLFTYKRTLICSLAFRPPSAISSAMCTWPNTPRTAARWSGVTSCGQVREEG